MRRWAIGIMLSVATIVGYTVGQEPGLLPYPMPSAPATPPESSGEIVPAQFTRPVGTPAPMTLNTPQVMPMPASAASPIVDIDLIVPQSSASTGVIPCQILVRNRSAADAYNVIVRLPTTRLKLSTIQAVEPVGTIPTDVDKNYKWKFSRLRPNETKVIKFDLKPDTGIINFGEMTLKAFVSFEHGVEAVTKFGSAKLDVQKIVAKELPVGEPVSVSLTVRNSGNAALHDVVILEEIFKGSDYAEGTSGEVAKTGNSLQRHWKLGTLSPGESKSIGYRAIVNPQIAEFKTLSKIDNKEGETKTSETVSRIVRAGLAVNLKADAEVAPGERTTYTIKVTNIGEMTQRNVAVTGSIPEKCKVTKMTNGGRINRDRVDWVIPELKGGQAHELRYVMQAESAGKRTVTIIARDERGKEYSGSKHTSFAASADLTWESFIDPVSITVGKISVVTVRVKNNGGDVARGVTLKVELPDVVRKVSSRPRDIKEGGKEIIFPTETILPGASRSYEVEVKGDLAGRGNVSLKLEADSFGVNRPLTAEKMIAVTASR
jgi:uncharacterized repeat protein (TIGR01451 family)